jgi:hypothetical protein
MLVPPMLVPKLIGARSLNRVGVRAATQKHVADDGAGVHEVEADRIE